MADGTERGLILGDGVALRAPLLTDRTRWLELMSDADELRWGVPAFVVRPTGVEGMVAVVESAAQRYGLGEPGAMTVVEPAVPDHFLGTISWRWDATPLLRVADLGYGVHPDARGRGLATAALAALARWLLHGDDGPALARVQLDHSVENGASCRVALGAGFPREGVRRGYLPLRDAPDAGVADPTDAAATAAPTAAGDDPGVRRHDVCLHGRLVTDA